MLLKMHAAAAAHLAGDMFVPVGFIPLECEAFLCASSPHQSKYPPSLGASFYATRTTSPQSYRQNHSTFFFFFPSPHSLQYFGGGDSWYINAKPPAKKGAGRGGGVGVFVGSTKAAHRTHRRRQSVASSVDFVIARGCAPFFFLASRRSQISKNLAGRRVGVPGRFSTCRRAGFGAKGWSGTLETAAG